MWKINDIINNNGDDDDDSEYVDDTEYVDDEDDFREFGFSENFLWVLSSCGQMRRLN